MSQYTGRLIQSLLDLVVSVPLTCEWVSEESSYGAGDQIPCGVTSVTFCDGEDCEQQLCGAHAVTCALCGWEGCRDCYGEHRC